MNNYFIILASGQSKRFNSDKPKQFHFYKNKHLYEHSLEKAIKSKLFKKIILVTILVLTLNIAVSFIDKSSIEGLYLLWVMFFIIHVLD